MSLVAAGRIGLVLVVTVGSVSACRSARDDRGPQIVQPGAPGQQGRVVAAGQAADLSRVPPTAADVQFMQGMIGHHAQAVEMVGLLPSRTEREDMRMLALRIQVSQSDEISMMQRWLAARGQTVADPHAQHGAGAMPMAGMAMPGMQMPGALMPGMLTPDEMARLAAAKGPEFDRLFLAGMIKHHEGALTMVGTLFKTPGAAQEAEIFAFASDVDADQRMEIDRMRGMLSGRQ